MAEVRNKIEGKLLWAIGSGSGVAFTTASASAYLLGYVRDLTWTSAQTIFSPMDRGVPTHHKKVDAQPVQLSFTVAFANTAEWPNQIATAVSGASVPFIHMELKQQTPERGLVNTGIWYQFHGVPTQSIAFTEGNEENTIQFSTVALAMNGPTASGYITT